MIPTDRSFERAYFLPYRHDRTTKKPQPFGCGSMVMRNPSSGFDHFFFSSFFGMSANSSRTGA